jgi:hypothetical protein
MEMLGYAIYLGSKRHAFVGFEHFAPESKILITSALRRRQMLTFDDILGVFPCCTSLISFPTVLMVIDV